MREPRNPFRLRASEHIESERTFVNLFSPEVLDMLSTPDIWERPQIIRSAPGGGKTSLLRLFTPLSLRTIYALRTQDYTKDLFKSLSALNAINDDGPCVLGILLSCGESFAPLEDLDIDNGHKRRLFLSLLNSRIILATLRGILDLKQIDSNHLRDVSFKEVDPKLILSENGTDITGLALHDWARKLERTVCEAFDSFLPLSKLRLPGHDSLFALNMISTKNLLFEGNSIAQHILVMFDDIHRLTSTQREWLLDTILPSRSPVGIWIAERLEALTVDKLLSPGVSQGRDIGHVITIEDYWRGSRVNKFEKMISNVADRRTRDARDIEISRFSDCLQDTLDGDEWSGIYLRGIDVISTRVKQKAAGNTKFAAWISEREQNRGTPRQRLLEWKSLEILLERELRTAQQTLDFIELNSADFEQRDSSNVHTAAELFIAREFNLPYYYGLNRLACMASSNIEQFLWLSGDIFEECVSAALLRQPMILTPLDQERILRKSIKNIWGDIPQRVRYGTQVLQFLESIGKLSQWETEKPNAPYAPGVTGIAISMSDRDRLKGALQRSSNDGLTTLANIIASCIAHNLLEVTQDRKCKGQYWMVMYLNRMFCVHFNLPLQYGGWREKRLPDILNWLGQGFIAPNNELGLFV